MREKFKIKPYAWQLKAIKETENKNYYGLFADMGCIAGDSELKLNRGGNSRRYKISDAYRLFNHVNLKNNEDGFNRNIPTKIRAFKNDHIGLWEISGIKYSGIKKVIKLTLENGYSISLTSDHEVLTSDGFVEAGKLIPKNSSIMVDTLVRYQKKDNKSRKAKCRYNLLQVGKFHPFSQRTHLRNKIVHRVEKHRLIVDAYENGLSLDEFIATTYHENNLNFTDPKKYEIHHKDRNTKNNSLENLEKLLEKDHKILHQNYKNFSHGIAQYSTLISMEDVGEQETFDIICKDPVRNFVANGIVVHNCGKTSALINILRDKYSKEKRILRTLILTPCVTIRNWKDEFKKHSYIEDSSIIALYQKTGQAKRKAFSIGKESGNNKIVIVNYEALVANEELKKDIEEWFPEVLVCDESHYLKTHNSKRTKTVFNLAKHCKYRFIMSGTPILNSICDIYSQYKILDLGQEFGNNFQIFQSTWMEDENRAWASRPGYFPKWVAKPDKFPELQERIYKNAIRVMKSDCLDLPERLHKEIKVELSTEQRKYYEEMKRDLITFINDSHDQPKAVVANLALTKALRLQQIISGFVKTEDGSVVRIKNNPRLDALADLIKENINRSKIIVWCSWSDNYEQIAEICKTQKIKYVSITGEQNSEEKYNSMKSFNEDESVRLVIANRSAGGVGINLVSSNLSIVYSRNFSLGDELQSRDRNYRGGSEIHERITQIDLVTIDTIDENVVEALKNKNEISSKIIDLLKQ